MKFGIFVFFVLLTIEGFCQQPQTFLPPITGNSPNVASLNKYGDYDVSHFTGVPNISIPLYHIKVNGLEVPVVLSYHASGIKVSDIASWAGAGWSLQVGGQISRKIMGTPDEYTDHYLDGSLKDYSQINDGPSNATQLYFTSIVSQSTDAEPDIFSYSFPGNSGRFFFNRADNYNAALIPFSSIKVAKERIGTNHDTLAFKILDTKGNEYVFGYQNRELTSTYSNPMSVANSAWMLEKMISADKIDTVYFTYNQQLSIPMNEATSSCSIKDDPEHSPPYPTTLHSEITPSTDGTSSSSTIEKVNKEVIFRGGKIVFELSSTNREDLGGPSGYPKSLKRILIYKHQNDVYELIRTIEFTQSYFTNGAKRLRLDALSVNDKSSNAVEVYQFNYNNSALVPNAFRSWDYWGYYNGKNNSSLIPRTQINYQEPVNTSYNIFVGSNLANGRDPDPAYTQTWILNKITYPTGGYTEFEYENNKYIDNGSLFYAGGLRVKSIKSYSQQGNEPIVKTYTYGLNESGGGRKNFVLNNNILSENKIYEEFKIFNAVPIFNNRLRVRTFHSNPVYNIETFGENSVVYPYVTEYLGTPTNNTGKIEYTYRDYEDLTVTIEYLKPRTISHSFDRGQVSNKKVFKKSGSTYQIIKEESFDYSAFPLKSYDFAGLVVNKKKFQFSLDSGEEIVFHYTSPYLSGVWEFSYYPILSDDNYLISKVVKDYDQNDITKFVTTTTTYSYNNIKHQQVNEISSTNSKGESIKQKSKYPADYLVGTNTTTGNTVLDDMMSKNMISTPIEAWNITTQSGTEKVTSASLATFKKLGSHAIVNDKSMQLEINAPITNFLPSSISGGALLKDTRYVDKVVFDSYDAKYNPSQITPRNASFSSYIWDYNLTYPIAKVDGAALSNIAYTSFESDGKGNWTFSGTPVPFLTISGKKVYNLTSGNITKSITSGITYIMSYWRPSTASALTIPGTQTGYPITGQAVNGWKYFEHRVSGQTIATISGSGMIDELRLYPATAEMITFGYEPAVGMMYQFDINSRATFYEYDNFSRLNFIRDQDKNIIKQICYNYAGQPEACSVYDNQDKSGNYTRACSTGYNGSSVYVSIPPGSFTSTVSVTDANNQALAYGQQQANLLGTCTSTSIDFRYTNMLQNPFSITLTHVMTSQTYTFGILPMKTSATIAGQILPGYYNVSISPAGGSGGATIYYQVGSFFTSSSANTVYANNVSISCGTCTSLQIY